MELRAQKSINLQELTSEAQFRRRTFHEPNLIQICTDPNYKSTPVDSDVELNSPNLIQFEPKLLEKNRKPKLLAKYVIIIYALGSARERFGV